MTDITKLGLVEKCVRVAGGNEDLVQETYLAIFEQIAKNGQRWLEEKVEGGYLDKYVYIVCRNKMIASMKKEVELFEDWHDEIDDLLPVSERLDHINLLEIVKEFLWAHPEGKLIERWLRLGSFEKLADDVLKKTGKRISRHTLYYNHKKIMGDLRQHLESKGYKKVQGMWERV